MLFPQSRIYPPESIFFSVYLYLLFKNFNLVISLVCLSRKLRNLQLLGMGNACMKGCLENEKEKDCLRDMCVEGSIILKLT
jgi:hypothetical protein